MSKLIKNKKSKNSILDLGCGSHFYEYLKLKKFKIKYVGVDIFKMIAISKKNILIICIMF